MSSTRHVDKINYYLIEIRRPMGTCALASSLQSESRMGAFAGEVQSELKSEGGSSTIADTGEGPTHIGNTVREGEKGSWTSRC